jgi:predicted transcriptional regulator
VPFDRLKNYLLDLKELGLIQDEKSLRLTDKGKEFIKEYAKVGDFINRMTQCKDGKN